ncbi:MAG TPA: DNA-directed RNA polymerase subunit beta' [Anaerohalosphaeraceae bacterium]|nr:DNA-directed RNA polymerase subunit beta' [Anaerohalosphaeraceae bacterium]HPC64642.1 DNA-directed RNA polymerase subunit beta' [Anaerohalosphaeraceae bacterium]HRS71613.1 DNA-directed RNA polymerase subunit beta' [Anaerohalosphaeraceae bacterium]HRV20847.1 DNA-directed RNA polymerase subunit beta' [Anaerohalosphaeraceae bacterium]
MVESIYDRINDYGSVKIALASPNDIRSWSFGEVRKPETINYRTYRPEKDGLFCERIFGPERDWECACGKYKGTKFKGIICDRCGVKVTHSRVRRKRMGHINLAAPVAHIWFFKALPSRLSTLLGMKTQDIEKIVYFQDYVVTDAGQSPLKVKQLLTEDEYRESLSKYGNSFRASMGAEAIKELLQKLDLEALSAELRQEISETNSKQKIKDLTKRLKLVNAIKSSENKPEWMILDVCPVIPPDLRPLVMLESGNFATSDLNDLYRRIINRNNRLKKLIDLNAPEVIIRNEKRMLQQAVDSLLDNSRCRRPVLGSNNRPLKSLTDMIKGKQGRFRENLLGKRVDYSARSVIVVGPNLKLYQCGLPKKIALELFQPFIIRKLKDRGLADTIKSAKRMLERREEHVWDILEEVIHQHPVLLNRAPTLHRMGIQAFEPVLVEGNAIMLHPLVCGGFNADFDGDQMAVHLPLSIEAQVEAHTLMLSINNIFSPASGSPMLSPSQDIVLGNYYITHMASGQKGEGRLFRDPAEAITAMEMKTVSVHAKVKVRLPADKKILGENGEEKGPVIETTPGRCLFNDILPAKMPFYNMVMDKKRLGNVIQDCFDICGSRDTIDLLDNIKELGFKRATLAGMSFGITDLRIPDEKPAIIEATQKRVDRVMKNYQSGILTEGERYNQIIDAWTHARVAVTNAMMNAMKNDTRDGKPYLNPIWVMRHSGARGSIDQIQQLAGMRALMAKPSGEIMETPIKSNFREGLNVLEYFTSTHGARKGLADTALKTADSGYLTRKLADVAQNVMISQVDCGTLQGITKTTVYKGETIDIPLKQLIIGRTARDNIRNPITDEMIVRENEVITPEAAEKIEAMGLDTIRVRSPLTCESEVGVCSKCYGWDLSTGRLVEEGLAVGIIAAQSIGEPGTQLTMRTFHTGGIASVSLIETDQKSPRDGIVKYVDLNVVETDYDGRPQMISLRRNGEMALVDEKGRELERFKVPYGGLIQVKDGQSVKRGQTLYAWDPHRVPILAEVPGVVRLMDIIEGETMRIEEERKGQKGRPVVIEHKGDKHPQVMIESPEGKILDVHYLPAKARIEVEEGQNVKAGTLLARLPRSSAGTQDITGGLPRVTEIFEARKPRDPAAMAEISGTVELKTDKRRGKMTIIVRNESGMEKEHHVPRDRHLNFHTGDHVEAGDALTDGPLVPHDILRIKGEEALQRYLLREVQNVYRAQSVTINDKHIEIILSQMMKKVEIENVGDGPFLPGEVVDKFEFRRANAELSKSLKITDAGDTDLKVGSVYPKEVVEAANEKAEMLGGNPAKGKKARPATANTLLLGITKASLQSESFISAASFQETTKVLTEASLAGKVDNLHGLKENVILGHLIPAGTAFKPYLDMKVKHLAEPPIPKQLEELREAKEAEAAKDKAVKAALGLE